MEIRCSPNSRYRSPQRHHRGQPSLTAAGGIYRHRTDSCSHDYPWFPENKTLAINTVLWRVNQSNYGSEMQPRSRTGQRILGAAKASPLPDFVRLQGAKTLCELGGPGLTSLLGSVPAGESPRRLAVHLQPPGHLSAGETPCTRPASGRTHCVRFRDTQRPCLLLRPPSPWNAGPVPSAGELLSYLEHPALQSTGGAVLIAPLEF